VAHTPRYGRLMRHLSLAFAAFALVACNPAPPAAVETPAEAAPIVIEPVAATTPAQPLVCVEDAAAAFQQRLERDAAWSDDPIAGGMNMRMNRYRISTHSLASRRQGLARYTRSTTALVTYAGKAESCAWVVSAEGIVAYGRDAEG